MIDPTVSATTDNNGPESVPYLAMRPPLAAKALGISKRKLWEITADRTSGIPFVRFGKCVVYPVKLLERWLAEGAQKKGGRP